MRRISKAVDQLDVTLTNGETIRVDRCFLRIGWHAQLPQVRAPGHWPVRTTIAGDAVATKSILYVSVAAAAGIMAARRLIDLPTNHSIKVPSTDRNSRLAVNQSHILTKIRVVARTMIFGAPDPYVQYVERSSSYAVAFNEAGAVLIVETGTRFALPGGGLEARETPLAALKREVEEETGFSVRRADFLASAYQYVQSIDKTNYLKLCLYFNTAVELSLKQDMPEHIPLWAPRKTALQILTEESDRWAVGLAWNSRSL